MKHLIWVILLLPAFAFAQSIDQTQNQGSSGGGSNGNVGQKQHQKQQQEQAQIQSTIASSVASSEQAQDNVQQTTFEGGAPDIVMVPNNNTEQCLRVIGIMFSNSSGGGGIGYPYRSRKCDYEAAADDAFAQGNVELGWYWKCQNKNLYKKFGSSEVCHAEMINMIKPYREVIIPEPIPQTIVNCDVGQHDAKHNRIFEACQVGK